MWGAQPWPFYWLCIRQLLVSVLTGSGCLLSFVRTKDTRVVLIMGVPHFA
jgi:hypothetical protein